MLNCLGNEKGEKKKSIGLISKKEKIKELTILCMAHLIYSIYRYSLNTESII